MAFETRKIIEARCEDCGALWTTRNCHKPDRVGKDHHDRTGHRVRVMIHVFKVYGEVKDEVKK